MTEEQERSQRQRAFDLVSDARRRVNPKTKEHIAEVASRHADDELISYATFVGWKYLVLEWEHSQRLSHRRDVRSGHQNASGRWQQVRQDILAMPVTVGEQHLVLGELHLEEVQQLISVRTEMAEELIEEAARFERIAAEMRAANVETVAELGSERVELLYAGEVQNA